ncbi:peptidase M48 [Mycolicibacterium rhodesiae]|uniref:Peptidase M48 n=2 Tax=Mycolicibacterium rhodesiae TaxID=36814 RepID=A0A1X0IW81_MYCRH|nr:M56 family metallopeptidase [Mycolicibacterium rhodesiae]ORB52456.1 peptidase M48 [Mycolicibacterium rhodesiae]
MWWTIGGIAVGVLTPPLLRALTRRGVDAAVLLAVWGVLVCVTLTAVALPGLAELLHRCWLALHAGPPGGVDTIAGIISAAALGIAAIRGGWQLSLTGRHRRRLHNKHAELAWLLTGRGPQPGAVLWLPAAEPLAYSLAGDPPLVVMSTGLQQCLDRASVRAVEAHERAHVGRRHHLLIAVAQAVAAGLGWLPLMRHSPSLVRTLVELDADAHAARTHGRQGLRRALHALKSAPAPSPALGIAGDCTELRLARLDGRRPSAGRIAGSSAVWGATLVLAVTTVLTFAALTGLASCTTG